MRYETTTSLGPTEALAEAERFFGGQFGLAVGARTARAVTFEGGGGHVRIAVQHDDPTTLELETREWDAAVHEYMQRLRH
jgi:extradiol dioxygenase family protein